MNPNIDEIREQLKKSNDELLKKENVVATGIGYKTVAGKTTSVAFNSLFGGGKKTGKVS